MTIPQVDIQGQEKSQISASLGKVANKVANSTNSAKFGAFRRLAFAQKVLIDNDVKSKQSGNIHRTRLCHSCRSYNAESISLNISSDVNKQKASLSGVQTCASVWTCPVCAPRIAMQRGKEITFTNEAMKVLGFAPIMITLTARHNLETGLGWHKGQFKLAWKRLQRDGSWKRLLKKLGISHRITSREVTWGALNGWHYHMHLLLYIPFDVLRNLADTELESWIDKLKKRWLACLSAKGLDGDYDHALNVKADGDVKASYLAKLGLTDETTNTNYELSAGRNKHYQGRNIWSILRKASEGDEHSVALYLEYAQAMSGDKWITWSNGLKDLVGLDEMPEEEAAALEDSPDVMEHLMDIGDDEYLPVRKMRAYADLLDLAAVSRSEVVVRQWLVKLKEEYQATQAYKDRQRMLAQYKALDAKMTAFRVNYNRRRTVVDPPAWWFADIEKWRQLKAVLGY